jgi:large subunit ribosomal protein L9
VANKAVIEQMKASAIRKSAKEKVDAETLSQQLDQVELVFERKVGEHDHLFGSVTSSDIAHALEAKGFTVDRRKIALDDPLKSIGEYHVPVKLHREVTSHVKVTVKGEQAEEAVTSSAAAE